MDIFCWGNTPCDACLFCFRFSFLLSLCCRQYGAPCYTIEVWSLYLPRVNTEWSAECIFWLGTIKIFSHLKSSPKKSKGGKIGQNLHIQTHDIFRSNPKWNTVIKKANRRYKCKVMFINLCLRLYCQGQTKWPATQAPGISKHQRSKKISPQEFQRFNRILFTYTFRSRTIYGRQIRLRLAPTTFEHGGIFIVLYLLWLGNSVVTDHPSDSTRTTIPNKKDTGYYMCVHHFAGSLKYITKLNIIDHQI